MSEVSGTPPRLTSVPAASVTRGERGLSGKYRACGFGDLECQPPNLKETLKVLKSCISFKESKITSLH